MKHTTTTTEFECDACGKIIRWDIGYPYEKGWLYLYHLEFKESDYSIKVVKDKHFCCKKCYLKFVERELE